MTIKTSIILPFNIKANSEVTGGYADKLHTEFAQETEIANYHEDDYRIGEKSELIYDAILQGPFTETWVGGRSHRHAPLNLGQDNAKTRPEAWHVKLLPNTIRLYSNAHLDSPPAYWTREEYSKRPISIKNIDNTKSFLGNYSENYEILQTSGRRIANNLIIDGFTASSGLTTQYITGANEYTLPELNDQGGSKSVIVERFNAPGSKEESSRGSLDREGEEMSPNIPLTYRNHRIRNSFYKQLSQHSPQFGSGSTFAVLPATGTVDAVSIHKVNRNRLVRAGNVQYDNWFVQHQIPRTDIQYSWITASALTTAEELGGFQPREYVGRQAVNVGIEFISGSLVISGSNQEYFVDNLYINSLVKESKKVDIETNTYSLSASLSASMAEYVNSPYTYTSWVSMRNGENLIARTLRKENIVSIKNSPRPITYRALNGRLITVKAKHGQGTINFKEPPVTYKYKPLTHRLKFSEDADTVFQIEHEYTNLISKFANKDLNTKLILSENETKFYDLLREQYKRDDTEVYYLGHSYKEIIWPREENTGLKETRKRNEYYLNIPGFSRDGYDIKLGTQRVFWRDEQQNKKRSKNSEGGYYSSIGYLSTEETGSNFVQNENGVLSNNSNVSLSASYQQDSSIDSGLFNSFSILESSSAERELFSYTGKVETSTFTSDGIDRKNLGLINKRGYILDVSGEFNNSYTNFYEQIFVENESYRKSIGTLYENTSYKALLTALPEERSSYNDFALQNEDEEIFANPKLKYVSFVGGGELNTGSFFQDENNFSNALSASMKNIDGPIFSFHVNGPDIYVGGDFTSIGNIAANKIAKWDTTTETWFALGDGVDSTVLSIASSGSDIYVGGDFTVTGNRIAKWDTITSTWSALGGGLNDTVRSISVSGSDIYVGGDFTVTGNRIAKWDTITSTWSALGGGFNYPVRAIAVSGSDIYAGGEFTVTGSGIAKWDTITSTWSALGGGINGTVEAITVSGSDIYAGGFFSSPGNRIAKWDTITSTWSALGAGVAGFLNTISLSGSDVYVGGEFGSVGGVIANGSIAKWNTLTSTWSTLEEKHNDSAEAHIISGSDIYVGGYFYVAGEGETIASKIAKYDINKEKWYSVEENATEHDIFSLELYNQTLSKEDIYFSTLDKGLQRITEQTSGKKPFFDSYEDFIEDIRAEAKQYSTIPEFRISEHMDYYVSSKGGNFRTKNKKIFSLDGANRHTSATSENSLNYDEQFIKTYSTSDILKKHDNIKKQNEDIAKIEQISLTVSGIKKLLPYNGFYPQDRTVQIANIYSDYVSNNLHGGTYSLNYRTDYFNDNILETESIYGDSLSVVRYGEKYFTAMGRPFREGSVYVLTSSGDDPTETLSILGAEIITGPSTNSNSNFGTKVQFISASNGLNLFVSGFMTGSAGTPGYMFICSSSTGETWSSPEPLEVYGSSPSEYVSGSSDDSKFGYYFDALYDNNNDEKILIAIGSYAADGGGTDSGEVYLVTGTLENNQWKWSDKSLIYTGAAANNEAGTGMSIISCSSGYQMFFAEAKGDNPSIDSGSLFVVTSSNGSSWSTPVVITSGSQGNIGYNDIKAMDFNGKTYVFFSDPNLDSGTITNTGGVFCITSSVDNLWPSSTTYLDKKLIYKRNIPFDGSLYPGRNYAISLFSGSDNRLYYGFANRLSSLNDYAEFVMGYADAEGFFQTSDQNSLFRSPSEKGYGARNITVAPYSVGEYSLPIFFMTDFLPLLPSFKARIRAIKNNLFTEFSLNVSNSEKYYKHAALEPFMAPGILYNTIKSGLAVDWPCATGSNTAIVPYGDNTIVNSYYPKSFEMASFSGSNVYESMYGQVRSNIDYRIPFENILFPNEAFKVKKYLEEDLVSRTVLSVLEDDDPLVQFIDQTYIYGGYEPYISPIDFGDVNNLGPKRFSVPFVYRKEGTSDTGLYTLAMNNFLAETVNFFLKDQKMTTFVSEPDNKWKQFNNNKTYYMDVVLEKSPDLIMMEAYHSELHPTGSNGEKMNGRYFGYPTNKTDKALWGGSEFTEEERKLIHNDPAYAPYTPPYFEGEARARISFKPSGTSRSYTVQEIFDEATIENIFVDIEKGATTGSDAYVNAMPIGSSFDLFGFANPVNVVVDEATGKRTFENVLDQQAWVISPKMETPVLDFSSQTLNSYENEYSKTSGFGRGMWSGYGSIPNEGKGIKARLEYPFSTQASPLTASLLDQIGLKTEERTIGDIADKKLVSEAIVLIPYLERQTEVTTKHDNKFHFIKLSKELFNGVKNGNIESVSISDTINKMQNYVIPPEFNFMQYSDIQPFVMYIFEFEHTLEQQDLADIWQGIMPEISRVAEKDEVSINHLSGENEFFEGKELPDNLRWMIFKVKKKAEKNYFNVTATTKDDQRFNFNKIIGREVGTDVYSYNWPYDFFSLVEFAKVELKLDYKTKDSE